MQKVLFRLLIILSFGVFLMGCQKSNNEITVVDSQILKELQFMKNEGMLTLDDYEKLIRMDNVLFTPSDIKPMVG